MKINITADHTAVQRNAWESYVLNHPEGTVFHMPGFYETYLGAKNYEPVLLLALDDLNNLKGLILAVIQREQGLVSKYFSARSIIFGGPIADDISITGALLEKYGEAVRGRAIYSQVRNFNVPARELKRVYRDAGFTFEEHLNIRVDLTVSGAEFWKGIKQNRRAGINKARKQGFTFRVTGDISVVEPFYQLLKSTYAANRLPFPDISFFRSLSEHLERELAWFILEKDSRPGIILAAFISKETLYIFYPGIDQSPSFLRLRPVDLFYYEVMKWAQENGVKTLDWMGAGKPGKEYGVRYFKQQYGGELFSPGRFQSVHRPVLMLVGKMGVSLLKIRRRK